MLQPPYDYGWMYGLWWIWWVVWFIIGILIAIWMYKDAKAEGENAIIWAIIGFFLTIIGLVIWLFYKKK